MQVSPDGFWTGLELLLKKYAQPCPELMSSGA